MVFGAVQMTDQHQGAIADLRPVGTRYSITLPGSPLDPRSKGAKATYEVVGHLEQSPGVFREDVRRVAFEKLKA